MLTNTLFTSTELQTRYLKTKTQKNPEKLKTNIATSNQTRMITQLRETVSRQRPLCTPVRAHDWRFPRDARTADWTARARPRPRAPPRQQVRGGTHTHTPPEPLRSPAVPNATSSEVENCEA